MKILVVDDSHIHQQAAKEQLKNHETIVVGSYDEGQKLLEKPHDFEVVLVDLLMPASRQQMGNAGMRLAGTEMPVGIFLALLAAKNGAKYVAVLSDSNHHQHPASACLDAFNEHEVLPTPFVVEGAKVLLTNNFRWCYAEIKTKEGSLTTKSWDKLLNYLLHGPGPEDNP